MTYIPRITVTTFPGSHIEPDIQVAFIKDTVAGEVIASESIQTFDPGTAHEMSNFLYKVLKMERELRRRDTATTEEKKQTESIHRDFVADDPSKDVVVEEHMEVAPLDEVKGWVDNVAETNAAEEAKKERAQMLADLTPPPSDEYLVQQLFTDRSSTMLADAKKEAVRLNAPYVGTEHLLMALAKSGNSVAATAIYNLGIDIEEMIREMDKLKVEGPTSSPEILTPQAKALILSSVEIMRSLDHKFVGTEHLLLAILKDDQCVAVQVIKNLDVSPTELRDEIYSLLGVTPAKAPETA